eukprot:607259-Amorphochlora_amoeboformis.AAC.1
MYSQSVTQGRIPNAIPNPSSLTWGHRGGMAAQGGAARGRGGMTGARGRGFGGRGGFFPGRGGGGYMGPPGLGGPGQH